MNFLDLFRSRPKTSAHVAKERLQIILAHERSQRGSPDYLPRLQREIVEVIAKYIHIDEDQVQVNFQNSGDCSVLELNITLPEKEEVGEPA